MKVARVDFVHFAMFDYSTAAFTSASTALLP
jgi:hypothetical protein